MNTSFSTIYPYNGGISTKTFKYDGIKAHGSHKSVNRFNKLMRDAYNKDTFINSSSGILGCSSTGFMVSLSANNVFNGTYI